MTELEPLVKTLEEANIFTTNTSDLTSTQFECRRVVMDSLDIEPGTVIVVGGWEAMRVVGNGDRNVGFDGRTYTHEDCSFVSSTMGLSDEEHKRFHTCGGECA